MRSHLTLFLSHFTTDPILFILNTFVRYFSQPQHLDWPRWSMFDIWIFLFCFKLWNSSEIHENIQKFCNFRFNISRKINISTWAKVSGRSDGSLLLSYHVNSSHQPTHETFQWVYWVWKKAKIKSSSMFSVLFFRNIFRLYSLVI